MNLKLLNIGLVSLIILTSCQSKKSPSVYYYTPVLSGQILDKETGLPIAGASVTYTSNTNTIADKDGNFYLPGITVFDQRLDKFLGEEIIYISVAMHAKGYQTKLYDSLDIPAIPFRQSIDIPAYSHVGKVYLSPLPQDMPLENMVPEEVKEGLTFCKEGESQRVVDCVPIPDGLTLEQAMNATRSLYDQEL